MSIKHFILIALLLTAGTIGAINTPVSVPMSPFSQNDGGNCNLPAPFYVQVDEVGTTWIKLSWGGNTSYKHRIRTYRASDNALLNTKIVDAGILNATIDTLPSGTEVFSVVNPVCNDGMNSPNGTTSPTVTTLIIDVVVQQFTPDNGTTSCSYENQSFNCTFSENGSTFKIFRTSSPNEARYFKMEHGVGFQYKATLQIDNSADNSPFDFTCQNDANPNPQCSGPDSIRIWDVSVSPKVLIGSFSAGSGSQTTTFYFKKSALSSNFTIQKILPGRSVGSDSDHSLLYTAPNPFSNTLDVFIGNTEAKNIHLQMFDLSGRTVLDRQFSGGQQQYTLPTENLANGFYLLRAEVDGKVETLKVIKSE